MEKVDVKILNLSINPNPVYANAGDAGMDLRADFSRIRGALIKTYGGAEMVLAGEAHNVPMLRLDPGSRALVPTGLFIKLPEGYEAQIRPRSGLALKEGLSVINTPGTIDSGYTGEIGIPMINLSNETRWIEQGVRICQLVLKKVDTINWVEVYHKDQLGDTERGDGGFGHSGKQ